MTECLGGTQKGKAEVGEAERCAITLVGWQNGLVKEWDGSVGDAEVLCHGALSKPSGGVEVEVVLISVGCPVATPT